MFPQSAYRILMLGWEYPPHISGGLGTACQGLSSALARNGAEILFVVPHLIGDERPEQVTLLDSDGNDASIVEGDFYRAETSGGWGNRKLASFATSSAKGVRRYRVPAALKPYWTPQDFERYTKNITTYADLLARGILEQTTDSFQHNNFHHYGSDIFEEVEQYALKVVSLFAAEDFDLVHAHDWMTFPAAVALAKATKKPLVLHIHSLEFDRSGTHKNKQISDIESWALNQADSVIGVSYYTRTLINQQYGVPLERVHVVHNGVYEGEVVRGYRTEQGWPSKVVLFLGRITFQKGPDYFVEAAAKVIPVVNDVLFVMAGSGDMLDRMVQRVNELGLNKYFHFPGFLRGPEVERMFSVADLYVMPSVSEPFGISALEAISYETPVIISRQSGVSEVLKHALKVDFWDVDKMADLIINALLHDELRADMIAQAREELKRLRWDASAMRTIDVYRSLI